jgi:hypothetical protein
MTFGNTIYIDAGKTNDLPLLGHEVEHSTQYAKDGFIGFLFNYGTSYIGNRLSGMGAYEAYRNIPYEAAGFSRMRQIEGDLKNPGGGHCGCAK